jgi:hypothetical protein
LVVHAERGLRNFEIWEDEQISAGHSRTSSKQLEGKFLDLANQRNRNTAGNAAAVEKQGEDRNFGI